MESTAHGARMHACMHARQQRPRRALAGLGLGQATPQDASCAPLSAGAASSHAGAGRVRNRWGGNGDPAWLDHARRGTRHHGRTSALKGTRQTGGFGPNSFFGFGSSPPAPATCRCNKTFSGAQPGSGGDQEDAAAGGETGFQCPGCAARWSAAWWRAPGAARRGGRSETAHTIPGRAPGAEPAWQARPRPELTFRRGLEAGAAGGGRGGPAREGGATLVRPSHFGGATLL